LLILSEDREIELVHDLAQRVLQHEAMMAKVSDILGELDWYVTMFCVIFQIFDKGSLCALAQGARKYRLTRPRLTEENVINIQGGR